MDFRPPDWVRQTNIYEVNIRQYTHEGTFKAFIPHLPRLKDMGVETLWLMPVTPISKKNRKGVLGSYYAASDYTSVNPEFGTLDDLRILVREAHIQGFRMIIDWVANHTGWDHKWTIEHPDYYKINTDTGDFIRASGMDDIIELNFGNPDLVAAMINAMRFWITECDIDGFRCDLAFWVELKFWQQARRELDTSKPLFWLGELDPLEHPEYMGAFDAAYTWRWMHRTEEYYKQRLPFPVLTAILTEYEAVGNGSMRAWFTSNHDENSWNGTEYEKYGDMAKALAVFSCTWNGLPLIYSGQELPNHKRLKFFEKDEIPWTGECELELFYTKLLSLHKRHPALAAGDPAAALVKLEMADDQRVLAYVRETGDASLTVVLNFSGDPVDYRSAHLHAQFRDVFSGEALALSGTLSLQAWSYTVLERTGD
ncbi:MAG TPA: alpha-amylase family glycosyl hydrolase [Chitinophagaceae bacterium]